MKWVYLVYLFIIALRMIQFSVVTHNLVYASYRVDCFLARMFKLRTVRSMVAVCPSIYRNHTQRACSFTVCTTFWVNSVLARSNKSKPDSIEPVHPKAVTIAWIEFEKKAHRIVRSFESRVVIRRNWNHRYCRRKRTARRHRKAAFHRSCSSLSRRRRWTIWFRRNPRKPKWIPRRLRCGGTGVFIQISGMPTFQDFKWKKSKLYKKYSIRWRPLNEGGERRVIFMFISCVVIF